MAYAFVQGTGTYFANGAGAATEVQAFPGNVTALNTLFVIVGWETTTTITSITDTLGNTYVSLPATSALTHQAQAFYCLSCVSSGANTVTAHFSGAGGTFIDLIVAEYSGIGSVEGHIELASPGGTLSGAAITTTGASDAVLGYIDGPSANRGAGAGWTARTSLITRSFLEDQLNVGAGTYTVTATTTNFNESGVIAFGPPHSISGNAGTAGATIAYTGVTSGSVIADGSGNYTILNLVDGSYTLTPSKTGFTFSPVSSNQTVAGANITGVNFTATSSGGGSVYSVPDCRVSPAGPNASRTVQGTKIYDVQTSSNSTVPGKDSRAAGAPVDSRVSPNIPQNSRTPGTFGPGVN